MKFVRYRHRGKNSYGILEGEKIKEITGLPFRQPWKAGPGADDSAIVETGHSEKMGNIELLCPCEPSKILAIGLNYKSHLLAQNRTAPKNPEIFFVPTSALLQPEGEIKFPFGAHNVHYEGELVVVIGRETRNVPASAAESCILGFTCGNDVSERDWQKNDLQWWRAKGCDTFAPLGPVITSGFDWKNGRVETRLNGTVVQSGSFSELLFDPAAIVSYASQYVTLYPGDVIYTGTPGNTASLKPGDVVEIEIPDIGTLRNRVAE